MKKINKIFIKNFFYFFLIFSVKAESKILSIGKSDAKVIVKVFSSLTCPSLCKFWQKNFYNLKKILLIKV